MFLSRVFKKSLGFILQPIVFVLKSISLPLQFLLNQTNAALYMLKFAIRPDDIFIVTYPRSGTTWLQMILYQMLSDGSMDIEHICEKCPFFDRLWVHNRLDPESLLPPRVFKTHLKYGLVPKHPQSRYIYIARDGLDVAVSYYQHHRTLFGYSGNFEAFFDSFIKGKVQAGSWADHVYEWWLNTKNLNVLYLTYEELKTDLPSAIDRIANFLSIDLDSEQRQRVLKHSSISYMKMHEDKFEHLNELLWELNLIGNTGKFIRNGNSGHSVSQMSKEQIRKYRKATHKIQSTGLMFPSINSAIASKGMRQGG